MLATLWMAAICYAQGTIQITFDGPPLIPAGADIGVSNYFEQGMAFTPIPPSRQFGRVGPGYPGDPQDGTAFVRAALTDSLMFSFTNGSAFGLVSVDLAGYSTVAPGPVTVPFIGFRPDGSTLTNSFTADGVVFQTFYFGPEFVGGLTKVQIPTFGWSLDNLGVATPEPGAGALLLLGGIAIRVVKWRSRRKRQT
jgi:hypothetical protein